MYDGPEPHALCTLLANQGQSPWSVLQLQKSETWRNGIPAAVLKVESPGALYSAALNLLRSAYYTRSERRGLK